MHHVPSTSRRVARALARGGVGLSAVMLASSMLGWFAPARAATLAGAAQVVAPTSLQPLTSGGSATDFTLKLPDGAACAGDSANANWRWFTYMVKSSIDPASLQFGNLGPTSPATGANFKQALYLTTGTAVANRQTSDASSAGGPGPIVSIPVMDLAVWGPGDISAGTYNIGIACTLGPASATQVDRYWNTQLTFTTAPNDSPAQVRWATATPATTTTTVAPATTTTVPATTTTTVQSGTTTTTAPATTSTTVQSGTTTTTVQAGTTTTTVQSGTTTTSVAGGTTTTTTPGAVVLSSSSGRPGASFTVTAPGFQPGSSAQIYFLSTPVLLTTVSASSTGVVQATVTVPSNAFAGAHTIEVRGTGSNGLSLTKSASFTVPADSGLLPRTGRELAQAALWALVMIVLGAVALKLGRPSGQGRHSS